MSACTRTDEEPEKERNKTEAQYDEGSSVVTHEATTKDMCALLRGKTIGEACGRAKAANGDGIVALMKIIRIMIILRMKTDFKIRY